MNCVLFVFTDKILTVASLFLVLALWFLGLIDIRWRAAELSRKGVNWAGELKSNGGSTTEELEGTEGGKGLDGVTDLVDAGFWLGESARVNSCDIV